MLADCGAGAARGLENEHNPAQVTVLNADVMDLAGQEENFDIVTMVGSTVRESGRGAAIVEKALSLVKLGGSQFLQTLLDEGGDPSQRRALRKTRHGGVGASARYGLWL